ncbi:MAG: winged helix-turn-helix domain-containing protein [Nitrososphaeraceae archaeon]|jgi:predicted transcriptional regulator
MKYRCRTDIIGLILSAANAINGESRSHIMYKSLVNYNQLKDYLIFLQQQELIEYDRSARTYRTTVKGRDFLELQRDMGEMAHLYGGSYELPHPSRQQA